jgi:hypothetical protein
MRAAVSMASRKIERSIFSRTRCLFVRGRCPYDQRCEVRTVARLLARSFRRPEICDAFRAIVPIASECLLSDKH